MWWRRECTTCRLLVLEGVENCSPETEKEKFPKTKGSYDRRIQVICQTTISGDVTVRRLVLNKEDIESRSENIISGRLGETKDCHLI